MKMIGARNPRGGSLGDSYGPSAGITMTSEDAATGLDGVKKLIDFMLSNARVLLVL